MFDWDLNMSANTSKWDKGRLSSVFVLICLYIIYFLFVHVYYFFLSLFVYKL